MAHTQDPNGNYLVGIEPVPLDHLPRSMGGGGGGSTTMTRHTGTGAPSNSIGVDGDDYVDLSTGNFYVKAGGAWVIVSGSQGASGGTVVTGVVDPNTVVAGPVGTLYVNTVNHTFWIKESGTGTSGWVEYVGPEG